MNRLFTRLDLIDVVGIVATFGMLGILLFTQGTRSFFTILAMLIVLFYVGVIVNDIIQYPRSEKET